MYFHRIALKFKGVPSPGQPRQPRFRGKGAEGVLAKGVADAESLLTSVFVVLRLFCVMC